MQAAYLDLPDCDSGRGTGNFWFHEQGRVISTEAQGFSIFRRTDHGEGASGVGAMR